MRFSLDCEQALGRDVVPLVNPMTAVFLNNLTFEVLKRSHFRDHMLQLSPSLGPTVGTPSVGDKIILIGTDPNSLSALISMSEATVPSVTTIIPGQTCKGQFR